MAKRLAACFHPRSDQHCWLQEELQSWYANCEMRTVVLSSTKGTNHPDMRHFPGYRIEHEHAAVTQGTTAMEQKQP